MKIDRLPAHVPLQESIQLLEEDNPQAQVLSSWVALLFDKSISEKSEMLPQARVWLTAALLRQSVQAWNGGIIGACADVVDKKDKDGIVRRRSRTVKDVWSCILFCLW